uniref:Protein kinase APK1A n=1 Tax=Arundo donax TaxID=35708 RepID=A0A0A8ZJ77_ARUDO
MAAARPLPRQRSAAAAGTGTGATRTCSRRPWRRRASRSSPQRLKKRG